MIRAGFVTVSRLLMKSGADETLLGENGSPYDVAKVEVKEMMEGSPLHS